MQPTLSRTPRERLMRFLELERRDRLHGRHRAVDELHRRPKVAGHGARLRHYLRIERRLTAEPGGVRP